MTNPTGEMNLTASAVILNGMVHPTGPRTIGTTIGKTMQMVSRTVVVLAGPTIRMIGIRMIGEMGMISGLTKNPVPRRHLMTTSRTMLVAGEGEIMGTGERVTKTMADQAVARMTVRPKDRVGWVREETTNARREGAMRLLIRRRMLVLTIAAAIAMTLPGAAQAHDTEEDETTTPAVTQITSTLPVLGSGLTVSLTRADDGAISQVAIVPSTGSTIVKENDHKVVFLLSDGDTEVLVRSGGGGAQTSARADATADVTGPGSWSADLFGTGLVTIPYTVSFTGNAPTITVGSLILPAGVTAEIGEPKIKTSDDHFSYRVKVKLTSGDDRAVVVLKATTHVNENGELQVALSVTLGSNGRNHDDHNGRGDENGQQGDNGRRGSRDSDDRGGGRDGGNDDDDREGGNEGRRGDGDHQRGDGDGRRGGG